jgi:hypothetical protein
MSRGVSATTNGDRGALRGRRASLVPAVSRARPAPGAPKGPPVPKGLPVPVASKEAPALLAPVGQRVRSDCRACRAKPAPLERKARRERLVQLEQKGPQGRPEPSVQKGPKGRRELPGKLEKPAHRAYRASAAKSAPRDRKERQAPTGRPAQLAKPGPQAPTVNPAPTAKLERRA